MDENTNTNIFETTPYKDECGVRMSTTNSIAIMFNAMNNQGEKVSDMMGVELDVTNIVVTDVNVPKEGTEDKTDKTHDDYNCKPCVHFFTSDGTHISSLANGIINSLRKLLNMGVKPSKSSPITIMFVSEKMKKGNTHKFVIVGGDDDE